MSSQERIPQPTKRKPQEQEPSPLPVSEGMEQAARLTSDIDAQRDEIAAIVGELSGSPSQEQIIGNPKQRLEMQKRSEEFVRQFQQRGGQ